MRCSTEQVSPWAQRRMTSALMTALSYAGCTGRAVTPLTCWSRANGWPRSSARSRVPEPSRRGRGTAHPSDVALSVRLDEHRERSVVHELDLHVRAERADLDVRATGAQGCHDMVDERLGDRTGRCGRPGRSPTFACLAVQRELADDEQWCVDVRR